MTGRSRSEAIEWARKCDGKRRFVAEQPAVQEALKVNRREKGRNLKAYPCEFCHHWHIGHSRD